MFTWFRRDSSVDEEHTSGGERLGFHPIDITQLKDDTETSPQPHCEIPRQVLYLSEAKDAASLQPPQPVANDKLFGGLDIVRPRRERRVAHDRSTVSSVHSVAEENLAVKVVTSSATTWVELDAQKCVGNDSVPPTVLSNSSVPAQGEPNLNRGSQHIVQCAPLAVEEGTPAQDTHSMDVECAESSDLRSRLERFFLLYDRTRLTDVAHTVQIWKGKCTRELFAELTQMYGPEPPLTNEEASVPSEEGSDCEHVGTESANDDHFHPPAASSSSEHAVSKQGNVEDGGQPHHSSAFSFLRESVPSSEVPETPAHIQNSSAVASTVPCHVSPNVEILQTTVCDARTAFCDSVEALVECMHQQNDFHTAITTAESALEAAVQREDYSAAEAKTEEVMQLQSKLQAAQARSDGIALVSLSHAVERHMHAERGLAAAQKALAKELRASYEVEQRERKAAQKCRLVEAREMCERTRKSRGIAEASRAEAVNRREELSNELQQLRKRQVEEETHLQQRRDALAEQHSSLTEKARLLEEKLTALRAEIACVAQARERVEDGICGQQVQHASQLTGIESAVSEADVVVSSAAKQVEELEALEAAAQQQVEELTSDVQHPGATNCAPQDVEVLEREAQYILDHELPTTLSCWTACQHALEMRAEVAARYLSGASRGGEEEMDAPAAALRAVQGEIQSIGISLATLTSRMDELQNGIAIGERVKAAAVAARQFKDAQEQNSLLQRLNAALVECSGELKTQSMQLDRLTLEAGKLTKAVEVESKSATSKSGDLLARYRAALQVAADACAVTTIEVSSDDVEWKQNCVCGKVNRLVTFLLQEYDAILIQCVQV